MNIMHCFPSSKTYYCYYLYSFPYDVQHHLYLCQLLVLHAVTGDLLRNEQYYDNCKVTLSTPIFDSRTALLAFLSIQAPVGL